MTQYLQLFVNKIDFKPVSWKDKTFMMGRIQLVNSVIVGALSYTF